MSNTSSISDVVSDGAKADLIGLVLGNQDLHARREDLQDVEGAHRGVDLLLLDADHLRHANARVNSLLANL